MLEAAREILEMVKHMPEYTLWVLLGILFYKVFIAGSWIMVARLLIVKLYEYFKSPPAKVVKYEINGQFIDEKTKHAFDGLLSRIKSHRIELDPNGVSQFYSSSYIHSSDIAFLNQALTVAIEHEKNKKAEKK